MKLALVFIRRKLFQYRDQEIVEPSGRTEFILFTYVTVYRMFELVVEFINSLIVMGHSKMVCLVTISKSQVPDYVLSFWPKEIVVHQFGNGLNKGRKSLNWIKVTSKPEIHAVFSNKILQKN